jgi:hypothetical protein
MRSSPDSSQVTANEPRKVLPLKQGSISSFKDSFIHTETESHFDEEPGLDAVAPSKVPDIYISNPPEAEEPPAKAPIARVKQPPMLKKIERQRLLQQKRDEERQEKRAQEVQQRRQERQLKEQQQKEQQLKEQLKGRCQQWQDEVSQQGQLKQQQTELPQNTDQDYAEDHELLHEERMRMEIDSKQQASATSMEPLAASRHSFGAHQLRNLACDLANLSHTIELALDQLPDQYLDDLSVELENDWAITDMNTMLRGVLATYIHGGDEKWVNGDKWRKKPSPQPE